MRAKISTLAKTSSSFTTLLGLSAALAIAIPAWGIDKDWNVAGTASWSFGPNWSPSGMPGPGDAVFIGNTFLATNGWVNLNVDATVPSITITDGMALDTNVSQLTVTGTVTASGHNSDGQFGYPSRLIVAQGAALYDFTTNNLVLTNEGRAEVSGGSVLRVNNLINIDYDSALSGEGYVLLYGDGAVALRVNGGIGAGVGGLTISQLGDGRIDLDGDVAGDSTLSISVGMVNGEDFSDLTINGDALLDQFDDNLQIGANNILNMNLSSGWAMGSGTQLNVISSSQHPGPAQINGGALTFKGSMAFLGTAAHGQINAPLTLTSSVDAQLGPQDRLECNGTTVVEGGNYTLGEDARIDFDGSTTVRGGTFTTFGQFEADGSVRFNGQTTWDGTITVNGLAQQYGNASVVGPTVINADTFDFDGGGTSAWSIGNGLTINASSLDPAGFNKVDGPVNITGTFLGKLTVNLAGNAPWIMDGDLSLSGVGGILVTRIEGTPFELNGSLELATKSGITADTWFRPTSQTTFAAATTQLRLSADSRISAGAFFLGAGEILLPAGSTMLLEHNANTASVGIVNNGTLAVGNSSGAAFIDRLTIGATGTYSVELGGHSPATQHDLLFVLNGLTDLNGSMDVKLIDVGNGVFDPEVGDQFIVLRASGGLVGAFQNAPVSYGSGNVYFWSLVYDSSTVTLKLDDILPCAADLNSDGVVNGADLGILLAAWGPCKGCQADLNGDTEVGGADLGELLAAWGPCL